MEPHNRCLPMGVPRARRFRAGSCRTTRTRADAHLQPGRGQHPQLPADLHGRPQAPAGTGPDLVRPLHRLVGRDTLVVDTVGYNDKFWFDRRGHPHTEQLHTIERWTRQGLRAHGKQGHDRRSGRVHEAVHVDVQRHASHPETRLLENICQENNQYGMRRTTVRVNTAKRKVRTSHGPPKAPRWSIFPGLHGAADSRSPWRLAATRDVGGAAVPLLVPSQAQSAVGQIHVGGSPTVSDAEAPAGRCRGCPTASRT